VVFGVSNHRLTGKYIVITGASSGIGEKMAYKVARNGAIPILLARNVEKLAETAKIIEKEFKITCLYKRLDVSDLDSIKATFTDILAHIPRVDILVNNAGFGIFKEVTEATLDELKAMFDVNVFGLIACTKMVLPNMMDNHGGHIINIASQAGKLATPKSSFYSASKHAVLGFTNSLRMEVVKNNIFVSAVNPGPIKTNFFIIADESGTYVKNVEKWMLDPDDVAEKIVRMMLTSKRELNLPQWMNLGSKLYQLFPQFVEKMGGSAFDQK
jgi:short-subunit dehydrogenase